MAGVTNNKLSRIELGASEDPGFGDVIAIGGAIGMTPNAIAELLGLRPQSKPQDHDDPRSSGIDEFLARATPQQRDRWLDLAYASTIAIEHLVRSVHE